MKNHSITLLQSSSPAEFMLSKLAVALASQARCQDILTYLGAWFTQVSPFPFLNSPDIF